MNILYVPTTAQSSGESPQSGHRDEFIYWDGFDNSTLRWVVSEFYDSDGISLDNTTISQSQLYKGAKIHAEFPYNVAKFFNKYKQSSPGISIFLRWFIDDQPAFPMSEFISRAMLPIKVILINGSTVDFFPGYLVEHSEWQNTIVDNDFAILNWYGVWNLTFTFDIRTGILLSLFRISTFKNAGITTIRYLEITFIPQPSSIVRNEIENFVFSENALFVIGIIILGVAILVYRYIKGKVKSDIDLYPTHASQDNE